MIVACLWFCRGRGSDGPRISPWRSRKIAVVISNAQQTHGSWCWETRPRLAPKTRVGLTEATGLRLPERYRPRRRRHFEGHHRGGLQGHSSFNPNRRRRLRRERGQGEEGGYFPSFCIDREINSTDARPPHNSSRTTTPAASSWASTSSSRSAREGKYAELLGLVGDNNTTNRSTGFHSVVGSLPRLEDGGAAVGGTSTAPRPWT
jgi:hypothetical protein